MTEFYNDSWKQSKNAKNDTELNVDIFSKESWGTRKGHNVFIQKRFHDQAKERLGETIENMDKEIGLKEKNKLKRLKKNKKNC